MRGGRINADHQIEVLDDGGRIGKAGNGGLGAGQRRGAEGGGVVAKLKVHEHRPCRRSIDERYQGLDGRQ